MGNKLISLSIIGSFVILFLFSFSSNQKSMVRMEEKKLQWKKLGVTLCLYKSMNYNDSLRRRDGSLAGYLNKNELFGIEDLEATKTFINNYLDTTKYQSKNGSSLTIMKCLDLIDDKDFDDFINDLLQNNKFQENR